METHPRRNATANSSRLRSKPSRIGGLRAKIQSWSSTKMASATLCGFLTRGWQVVNPFLGLEVLDVHRGSIPTVRLTSTPHGTRQMPAPCAIVRLLPDQRETVAPPSAKPRLLWRWACRQDAHVCIATSLLGSIGYIKLYVSGKLVHVTHASSREFVVQTIISNRLCANCHSSRLLLFLCTALCLSISLYSTLRSPNLPLIVPNSLFRPNAPNGAYHLDESPVSQYRTGDH